MRQKEAGVVGDAQILLQQPSEGSTLPDVEDQGKLPKIHDIWVRIWRMLYTDPRWQRHTKRWQHELEQQQETAWWMWGIISSLVMPEQQIWSQGVRHNLERPKSCPEGCDFILQVRGSLKGLQQYRDKVSVAPSLAYSGYSEVWLRCFFSKRKLLQNSRQEMIWAEMGGNTHRKEGRDCPSDRTILR